ncbi:hypothetical protein SDRG_17285, partial [Saprolegnia diclina VS20]
LLYRSEEELSAPAVGELETKLAEPRAVSSPVATISAENPQPLIKPPTSDVASDADTAPVAVTPTTLIASTVSP